MTTLFGTKVIVSDFCTEDDGYEDKEIFVKRGGFWERIFDTDPTLHIWDDYKTKTIKVPKRKPAMYMVNGDIFAHPDIIKALTNGFISISNAFGTISTATRESSFSMEDFKNAVAKLENFK